jgi:hypothetical protein
VLDAITLRIDHDHSATSKQSKTNDLLLTIVSPAIGGFDGGTSKNAHRIEKVEAPLLKGAQPLARIKADPHAGWLGPGRQRDQSERISMAMGERLQGTSSSPRHTPH